MFPMTLYWTHRGMRQLTYGGKVEADGTNKDPTDAYSYWGLTIASTIILGAIGATTGTVKRVFSRLGVFADVVHVVSPAIYATTSTTPGVSGLLRAIFKRKREPAALPEHIAPEEVSPVQNVSGPRT